MARITGHALLNEGAGYDDNGDRIGSWIANTAGEGRAKCQCGELSEWLPSGGARRKWHASHKTQIANTKENQ
jgi:hypothetical protein